MAHASLSHVRNHKYTGTYSNELDELGLIFKDTSQKRNIEYYNYDVLDLLN